MSHPPAQRLACFAVTAPGLEPLCAAELRALGVRPKIEQGGVTWTGSMESVASANLWLRTASRVIVRVAEFRATAFHEVERRSNAIAWDRFVAPGGAAEFRVTCRKSKLYHSDAVAERFMAAIARRVPGVRAARAAGKGEPESIIDLESISAEHQLFVVRFLHDVCSVSVDTSGELLHRRGYRQELAKAPLRETLGAAILLGAGWKGETALTDPMCGSGTIPIEAAMIARRMAPGRERSFAFLNWPSADRPAFVAERDRARAGELARSPVAITGSDRDAGAIAASAANARRAGVEADVAFGVAAISDLAAANAPGLVAINPPYGLRVGETKALRNLYARMGDVLRAKRPGWTVALLSADRALDRQTKLELEDKFRTKNGGIDVHLAVGAIPAGDVLP